MLTHKDRSFINKNINATVVSNELLATRDQWLRWSMVNSSVKTSVNHSSYAEVLQSSWKSVSVVSHNNHPKVQSCIRGNTTLSPCNVDNTTDSSHLVPLKCVHVKQKM